MKSEKLFESISDIEGELIIKADEYKFKKKKRNIIPFAASLAAAFAAIIIAGIMVNNTDIGLFFEKITNYSHTEQNDHSFTDDTTKKTEDTIPNTESESEKPFVSEPHTEEKIKPQTLAKASYPDFAPYPPTDEKVYDENFDIMYEAWREDINSFSSLNINTSAVNSFSKKIIEELLTVEGTDNKIISPLNIYMALSILAETADGESREQILSLLGVDSVSSLRTEAQNLWKKNYRDDGYMKSILANSLWLNDNIEFKENTVNILADKYYASVFRGTAGSESYNKLLNEWIIEQTDGLLTPDLKMEPDTIMALVSTLLFKTKWRDEFFPQNTENGIFHSSEGDEECEFMKKNEVMMHYYWGENFSAVNLSLDIGGRMWFILPDEGVSENEIFADEEVLELITLDSDMIYSKYENSKYLRVNLSVPKFDISAKTDLKEALTKLGVTNVFDSATSDFSPIAKNHKNIFIEKAIHDVRVKIDEEGVSAAAYTALIYAGSTAPPDEIVDFILDRPFAFAITLDGTTPLFAGIVERCS